MYPTTSKLITQCTFAYSTLRVAIIGAGSVGLATAISIGENDSSHSIDIYEKSTFLTEIGAAIRINLNAARCLKAL